MLMGNKLLQAWNVPQCLLLERAIPGSALHKVKTISCWNIRDGKVFVKRYLDVRYWNRLFKRVSLVSVSIILIGVQVL